MRSGCRSAVPRGPSYRPQTVRPTLVERGESRKTTLSEIQAPGSAENVRIDVMVFGNVLDILEQSDDDDVPHVSCGADERALHFAKQRCEAIEHPNRHSVDYPFSQSRYIVVRAARHALR